MIVKILSSMYLSEMDGKSGKSNLWHRTTAEFMLLTVSIYFTFVNLISAFALLKYGKIFMIISLLILWFTGFYFLDKKKQVVEDHIVQVEKDEFIGKRSIIAIKYCIYAITVASIVFYGKWHYLHSEVVGQM